MNVLVISYSDLRYDGRLRELIKLGQFCGDCYYITSGAENSQDAYDIRYKNKYGGYAGFIFFCLMMVSKLPKIDVLIADNRRSIIPAYLIKLIFNIKFIIQDVRELYVVSEMQTLIRKTISCLEILFMKKADMVLAANGYRADYMYRVYKLNKKPLIFENIRLLKYCDKFEKLKYQKRYESYFDKNAIKLVSTSGCSFERTNDELVRAVANIDKKIQLFLVGSSENKETKAMRDLIEAYGLEKSVFILPLLNESELKYVISNCDIGIVNYSQKDTNNIFCASGKIFEFIFEDKPVITTSNPPLKAICKEHQIGVSGDDYAKSIKAVSDDYDFYKTKVIAYHNLLTEQNGLEEFFRFVKNQLINNI